jgi:alpha-amylase/alpha-mannosidase (GH57 family)
MDRFICIHGHFYQPPRENPWLESVELQDSAYPYHDWNERITAECYAPNAVARMMDGDGRIVRLVNNYSRMSFNFGPTLLSWLERHDPQVYSCILQADQQSQERFGGHGSAMAQAYNHMIMPLANRRDKRTQILWGIRDFEHRFGRAPEGMWLPETAVDLESLDIMAELGIRFTILSPYQAARWRDLGGRARWQDATQGRIDPTRCYLQKLSAGRSMAIFFYDGPISQALAFEKLLTRGENLVNRLVGAFIDGRQWPQLVHIATDGETYGHHHAHGDMALAYALQYVEEQGLARLINYGQYLEMHPPKQEIQIAENTAWSCVHGVERWRSDCGCNSGRPGWNQAWRGPLRNALDWLRDEMAPRYERFAGELLRDPWEARDEYIQAVLDRSTENLATFFARQAKRALSEADVVQALKALELQRHAMLMYTSCGWFFDEISGVETVQVIQYAGRAAQLAQDLFGEDFEQPFLERLALAKGNLPEHGDGRAIYEKWVRPMALDWERVAAHYAVSSLFETFPEQARLFCFRANIRDIQSFQAGKTRLLVGHTLFTSEIVQNSAEMSFAVLHMGDHNVNAGVRPYMGDEAYRNLVKEMEETFARADFGELIRVMDRGFGESTYSLRSLFRDEQQNALKHILHSQLADATAAYRRIHETQFPMMRFLGDLGIPQPRAFLAAMDFLLNHDIRWELDEDEPTMEQIRADLKEVEILHVRSSTEGLAHRISKRMTRTAVALKETPRDLDLLSELRELAELAQSIPSSVDAWQAQNVYFELVETEWPKLEARFDAGEEDVAAWGDGFLLLGEKLGIQVEELKKKAASWTRAVCP